MKASRWILLLAPLVMLVAGQDNSSTAQSKPRGRLTLPEGAQKIDAYSHSHTDKDGKSWIYRQTPFGLVRYQDESKSGAAAAAKTNAQPATSTTSAPSRAAAGPSSTAAASPKAESIVPPPGLRAFDEGDSVRFEKDGPFGKYTWVRKKDELTAQEKIAWEAAQKSHRSGANKAKQE